MYRKILIKTEADLPKEKTIRICHLKKSGSITDIVFNDDQDDVNYWLRNIDWYLIEQPIAMPSEEEISLKLDSVNFETSKEREECYDLLEWMRDEIERLNKDNTLPKHKTLEDSGSSFETGV